MKNTLICIFVLIFCVVANGSPKTTGAPASTNDNSVASGINSSAAIQEKNISSYSLKGFEGKTIQVKLTNVATGTCRIIPVKHSQKTLEISHSSNGWNRLEFQEFDSSKGEWIVIQSLNIGGGRDAEPLLSPEGKGE